MSPGLQGCSKSRRSLVFGILLVSAVLFALTRLPIADWCESAASWLSGLGQGGAAVLVLFMWAWIMAALPVSPVELLAGFTFGFLLSLVICTLGKLGGAILSFMLGRHYGRGCARQRCFQSQMLRVLEHAVQRAGFRALVLFQFATLPMATKNYGMAMLSDKTVSLAHFSLSCALAGVPYTLAFSHIGANARTLAALLRGKEKADDAQLALLICGIAALLFTIALLRRAVNRALRNMRHEQEQEQEQAEQDENERKKNQCQDSPVVRQENIEHMLVTSVHVVVQETE